MFATIRKWTTSIIAPNHNQNASSISCRLDEVIFINFSIINDHAAVREAMLYNHKLNIRHTLTIKITNHAGLSELSLILTKAILYKNNHNIVIKIVFLTVVFLLYNKYEIGIAADTILQTRSHRFAEVANIVA